MQKRLSDREIFTFAVGAVQDAVINPKEKRKMKQVYSDFIKEAECRRSVEGLSHRQSFRLVKKILRVCRHFKWTKTDLSKIIEYAQLIKANWDKEIENT
jgi:hypothetical protein